MAVTRAQRVGKEIRRARARAGYLTIDEFAEAVGCSRTLISDLELGRRGNFKDDILWRIEGELGWEEDEIRLRLAGKTVRRSHPEDLRVVVDNWRRLNPQVREVISSLARSVAE